MVAHAHPPAAPLFLVVIRAEPDPTSRTGLAYRAYFKSEGRPLEALHLGGETELEATMRVRGAYPTATIAPDAPEPPKKTCCASCASGGACTSGCGGHGAHDHATENPLPVYARDHQGKVSGPVFAVGEGEAGAGECSVFGCGGCASATPAAPTALRFEMAQARPVGQGGGYALSPAPLHALPPELQALYARGACQGEACLPLFRVQPVDPAYFREALEKARALGPLTNSKKLYGFLKEYFAPPTKKHPQGHLVHEQEEFVCLSLDVHGYVRGLAPIARGARDSVQTPIADILRVPIVAGASSFVVAHNHPSGNCKPSKSDDEVTKALVKATAAIEGLLFLDHLVIGEGRYYSFRDHKKM